MELDKQPTDINDIADAGEVDAEQPEEVDALQQFQCENCKSFKMQLLAIEVNTLELHYLCEHCGLYYKSKINLKREKTIKSPANYMG